MFAVFSCTGLSKSSEKPLTLLKFFLVSLIKSIKGLSVSPRFGKNSSSFPTSIFSSSLFKFEDFSGFSFCKILKSRVLSGLRLRFSGSIDSIVFDLDFGFFFDFVCFVSCCSSKLRSKNLAWCLLCLYRLMENINLKFIIFDLSQSCIFVRYTEM